MNSEPKTLSTNNEEAPSETKVITYELKGYSKTIFDRVRQLWDSDEKTLEWIISDYNYGDLPDYNYDRRDLVHWLSVIQSYLGLINIAVIEEKSHGDLEILISNLYEKIRDKLEEIAKEIIEER